MRGRKERVSVRSKINFGKSFAALIILVNKRIEQNRPQPKIKDYYFIIY